MEDRARTFWEFYKTAKGGQGRIIRSGFGDFGVYEFNSPFDDTRSESDLEHVSGFSYLVQLFNAFYPEIISDEAYKDFSTLALIHELGEIKIGDIQDDGRRDDEKKDREERIFVKKMLRDFPEGIRTYYLKLFTEFQQKSTDFGKTAYAIDKLEAVLMGFVYEFQGRGGDLINKYKKVPKLSSRDIQSKNITNSRKIPDMWGCQFIIQARKRNFRWSPEFIDIMQAASLDVRGKELSWINDFSWTSD